MTNDEIDTLYRTMKDPENTPLLISAACELIDDAQAVILARGAMSDALRYLALANLVLRGHVAVSRDDDGMLRFRIEKP